MGFLNNKRLFITLARISVLIASIFLFLLILPNNSINYLISFNQKTITIQTVGHTINIPTHKYADNVAIYLNPQERFSTPQYLIPDEGFVQNSLRLIILILLRDKPTEFIYNQSTNTSKNYIHFNPFRSSLIINRNNKNYRLDMNIPDKSLEVWEENTKINSFPIRPPWLKLILSTIFSSFTMASILYNSIVILSRTIFFKKISSINFKEEEKFKQFFNKLLPPLVFIFGSLLIGFIFINVFKAMPGFGDEMNYLVQAKIFASGKVYINEPSLSEFFRVSWMDLFGNDGRIWNFHPPGNSVILMIGWLAKIPWITVPFVGGLILLIQFLIAKKIFQSNIIALLHVAIVASSHYFLSLASSFMAHAPSLLFISLFYLFTVKLIKEKGQRNIIYAVICISVAFIVRPLSAVLSAIIPFICIFIFLLKQKTVNYYYLLGSLILGSLIVASIFAYSYIVNGTWDLPYMIKGPEAGKTLSVRMSQSWDYKLENLYRNSNEFQNRAHSFGYLVNFTFFLVPFLAVFKKNQRIWILSAYLSFFIYLIIHSFLHWYGWKWEPRMIYDISFIFFLITTYGIWIVYKSLQNIHIQRLFTSIIGLSLLFIALIDLPYRFTTEYKNYNFQPIGVREAISRNKVENAIIFFESEFLFAPYSPQNSLSFDGDIIYAISQADNHNCKLINKFPNKKIYYSPDAQTLIERSVTCK